MLKDENKKKSILKLTKVKNSNQKNKDKNMILKYNKGG
jgi:hypothetical protein